MDVRIQVDEPKTTLLTEHSVFVSAGMLGGSPKLTSTFFLTPSQDLSLQVHVLNSPHGPPILRNTLNAVGSTSAYSIGLG